MEADKWNPTQTKGSLKVHKTDLNHCQVAAAAELLESLEYREGP